MKPADLSRMEAELGLATSDPAARLAAAMERVAAVRRAQPQPPASWCPHYCPGLRPGALGLEINNFILRETLMRYFYMADTIAETEAELAKHDERVAGQGPQRERPCDREAVEGCARARTSGNDESCPYMRDVRFMVERFGYPPPRTEEEMAAACRIDAERDAAHGAERVRRRDEALSRAAQMTGETTTTGDDLP
jgi:hypothetical protein